jgi:hypothetical protein
VFFHTRLLLLHMQVQFISLMNKEESKDLVRSINV